MGQAVGVDHEELALGFFVGDNIGTGTLGTGTCGGVDGDDGGAVLFGLVDAVVVLDPTAVGREDGNCLGNINGATATDGDDRTARLILIESKGLVNDADSGVRLYTVINNVVDLGIIQDGGDLACNAGLHESLVGDDQNTVCAQSLQEMGDHGNAITTDQGVTGLI